MLYIHAGLAGSNLLENTEVFSIVGAAEDAWCNIYTALYKQKDTASKVKKHYDVCVLRTSVVGSQQG